MGSANGTRVLIRLILAYETPHTCSFHASDYDINAALRREETGRKSSGSAVGCGYRFLRHLHQRIIHHHQRDGLCRQLARNHDGDRSLYRCDTDGHR